MKSEYLKMIEHVLEFDHPTYQLYLEDIDYYVYSKVGIDYDKCNEMVKLGYMRAGQHYRFFVTMKGVWYYIQNCTEIEV